MCSTQENDMGVCLGELIYTGKVRDVYQSTKSPDELIMVQTDRCSSYNHHVCNIEGKGELLTKTAVWWFNKTNNIIDNHLIRSNVNMMYVKKCFPIKLEIIIRAYITGSLWKYYQSVNGEENGCSFCGVQFPPGLSENQKLTSPVITPTLKNENDDPTSMNIIIEEEILTEDQLFFIKSKSMELFKFGSDHCEKTNLILVDTKYEFGFDINNNIILMDEIHTADSSRFWFKDSYLEAFNTKQQPQKLDKDIIRMFIKNNDLLNQLESGNDISTQIPNECRENLINAYRSLYEKITQIDIYNMNVDFEDKPNNKYNYQRFWNNTPRVIIIAGSTSDEWHVNNINNALIKLGLHSDMYYSSAHKNTKKVLEIIDNVENNFSKIIWVTVAGMSNALSGVVACNTKFPVIACPPFKDKSDIAIDINSTLRCPSNVPVMTILSPGNVALSVKKIFNL